MDYEQELKELSEVYAAELPAKLASIKSDWSQLKQTCDNGHLTKLIRKIHSLIGSGATFGFVELSKIAAALEKEFRQYQQQALNATFSPEDFEQLFQLLENAAQQRPGFDYSSDQKIVPLKTNTIAQTDESCVLLVSDNEAFTTELNAKLKIYAIQSQILSASIDLSTYIKTENPKCILLDISTIQKRTYELETIKTLSKSLAQPHSLIVVSEQDDMPTRLAAVRSGAHDFFLHPVNFSVLVNLIREQCYPVLESPYRILLVDDDVQFVHHTALLLKRAGMETHIVTDPMMILEKLTSFQPELILMDLYMPECNGFELATIIRQHCLYTAISIVFFSVETDINQHIEGLRAGGNDFFIKGLPPKQLVARVEATAKNVRAMQNLMLNDTLTGLSNRAHFTEILSKHLAASQRHNHCFSFVILDLDHFKQVNDQFGHQAGDDVLRSLASLITQRLRTIDAAIRYGGEEIVLLLPETKSEQAYIVINELQQKLSEISFMANKQSFSVTFSAGIAEYPGYKDQSGLFEAADKALYQAKAEGRNRICLA